MLRIPDWEEVDLNDFVKSLAEQITSQIASKLNVPIDLQMHEAFPVTFQTSDGTYRVDSIKIKLGDKLNSHT